MEVTLAWNRWVALVQGWRWKNLASARESGCSYMLLSPRGSLMSKHTRQWREKEWGGEGGGEKGGKGEGRDRIWIYMRLFVSLCFVLSGSWIIRWHSPTLAEGEFPSLCFLIWMTTSTTDTLIDVSRKNALPAVLGIYLLSEIKPNISM